MRSRVVSIFMFTLTLFNIGYGKNGLGKTLLLQLYRQGDSSVLSIEDEKCYLNVERLSLSEDGIHLHFDYLGPASIRMISKDKKGIYVDAYIDYYVCRGCDRMYDTLPLECEVCRGTDFSIIPEIE